MNIHNIYLLLCWCGGYSIQFRYHVAQKKNITFGGILKRHSEEICISKKKEACSVFAGTNNIYLSEEVNLKYPDINHNIYDFSYVSLFYISHIHVVLTVIIGFICILLCLEP